MLHVRLQEYKFGSVSRANEIITWIKTQKYTPYNTLIDEFEIGGIKYKFIYSRTDKRNSRLECNGNIIAKAHLKKLHFTITYPVEINFSGRELVLKKVLFRRKYNVFADDKKTGSIYHKFFGLNIDLDNTISDEIQVFIGLVCLDFWNIIFTDYSG